GNRRGFDNRDHSGAYSKGLAGSAHSPPDPRPELHSQTATHWTGVSFRKPPRLLERPTAFVIGRFSDHSFSHLVVPSAARRPVRVPIRSVVVSVPLVPLLVAELPALLGLVFPQFRAIAVHVSLALLMVAQSTPFGSLVLPDGIFPPISGPAPSWTVGTVRASRAIIYRRPRLIPRTPTTTFDRENNPCAAPPAPTH